MTKEDDLYRRFHFTWYVFATICYISPATM